MNEVVKIENQEIVIRIPFATIPIAAEIIFDEEYHEEEFCRVTDVEAFAKSMVNRMCREEENGDTIVTDMLDKAVKLVVEYGGGDEGFEFYQNEDW